MCSWLCILAARDSGSELFSVIAILILAVLGAVFEKVKQKMGENAKRQPPATMDDAELDREILIPRQDPPRPQPPVFRPPPAPARSEPAREPVQRPGRSERVRTRPARRTSTPAAEVAAQIAQQAAAQAEESPPSVSLVASVRAEPAAPARVVAFRKPTLAELRRAIVLNEVLGRPLALRHEADAQ